MESEIFKNCMHFGPLMTGNECASWVQAWGSISAIIFSVASVYISFSLSSQKERKRLNIIAFVEAGVASSELMELNGYINSILDEIADLAKVNPDDRNFHPINEKIKLIKFLTSNQMLALFPVGVAFAEHSRNVIFLQKISLRISKQCDINCPPLSSLNEVHGCLSKLRDAAFNAGWELMHYINRYSKKSFK